MQRAILRLNRSTKNNEKSKMVIKALVFLIDGNEESEVVITVDTLRRAGIECILAGVNDAQPVTCVQHLRILPDIELSRLENEDFDIIVVPGGPGSERFTEFDILKRILKRHVEMNKLICAICAG